MPHVPSPRVRHPGRAGYRPWVSTTEVLPESLLRNGVDVLVRLVEAAGALIIFVGAGWAFVQFVRAGLERRADARKAFVAIRLSLGRFLALGLEFQLAGDVLRTAIAPSFAEIGQLAAIAAIRTALNYFLAKEIREERAEIGHEEPGEVPRGGPLP
jgi:uncharacterized membrane protein